MINKYLPEISDIEIQIGTTKVHNPKPYNPNLRYKPE